MFQGATELSLDAKGRLAVPTRYREALTPGGGGVVLTAILVAAIGVLSSLDVLRNKPLATLRAE